MDSRPLLIAQAQRKLAPWRLDALWLDGVGYRQVALPHCQRLGYRQRWLPRFCGRLARKQVGDEHGQHAGLAVSAEPAHETLHVVVDRVFAEAELRRKLLAAATTCGQPEENLAFAGREVVLVNELLDRRA